MYTVEPSYGQGDKKKLSHDWIIKFVYLESSPIVQMNQCFVL